MAGETKFLDKVLEQIGKADRYLHSNEGIVGGITKAVDAPFDNFISREGTRSVGERLADKGYQYSWRDAARFGLQTYGTAAVAGRVLSGGGLYKDSQGNTDIIGIPFI